MLRHSSLFEFGHRDHTCVFYRSDDSHLEILTPYVAEGLHRGERCFCAEKPHIRTRLLSELRGLGFDTDDLLQRGSLEIRGEDEVYLPNGKFDPHATMDTLMRSLNETLQRGFTAFRTAGDASWAMEDPAECGHLLAYEGLVNGYFPRRAAIGLCQYDVNAFDPRTLESVVATHDLYVRDVSPSSPNYSEIVVRKGDFWFDIVASRVDPSPIYYYVVRRRRSSEVVGWGIALSYDQALSQASAID